MKLLLDPVPHDEAAKFIAGKPAMGRSVFDRLLPELKARAFTISGVAAADTLQRARDLIAELPRGADWDTQKAKLVGEISPFLVDESADPEARQKQVELATRRAEVLMRLHGFQAYAAAQHEVMARQTDAFPFWMYQTFGDGRVRPSHAALNGIILPADHPFWKDHTPPWDWGCRCNKVPVTTDEAADFRQAKPGAAGGWVPQDAVVKRMEQTGMLDTGDGRPVDIRSPKEKADDPATAFGWDPGDLRLSADDLAKRYDAETWTAFRSWAEAQTIESGGGNVSVWSWLTGTKILPPTAPVVAPPVPLPPPPKKVVPPAPAAGGAPVSDALKISPTGQHGKDIREALIAIDSVHRDGKLPGLKIDPNAGAGNLGVYVSTFDGKPVRIGVRPASKGGSHVLMTTAHEVGHFLDQQAFGLSGGKFASEKSQAFAGWRSAIDKSSAVATMLQSAPPAQLGYYRSYREMWARSYAQFIAVKSQDQRMLAELSKTLNGFGSWRQWAPDDFASVATEIEKILKAEGWM